MKIQKYKKKIYSRPILIFELKKGCYEKIGIWMQKNNFIPEINTDFMEYIKKCEDTFL